MRNLLPKILATLYNVEDQKDDFFSLHLTHPTPGIEPGGRRQKKVIFMRIKKMITMKSKKQASHLNCIIWKIQTYNYLIQFLFSCLSSA